MTTIESTNNPAIVNDYQWLNRYDVHTMVTELICGIKESGVTNQDAEDYLLHLFGGRLEDAAIRVNLPVDQFVDILFTECLGDIDGSNVLRRRTQELHTQEQAVNNRRTIMGSRRRELFQRQYAIRNIMTY